MKCKYYHLNCPNPASGNLCDCYEDCPEYYKTGLKNQKAEISGLEHSLKQAQEVLKPYEEEINFRAEVIAELKDKLKQAIEQLAKQDIYLADANKELAEAKDKLDKEKEDYLDYYNKTQDKLSRRNMQIKDLKAEVKLHTEEHLEHHKDDRLPNCGYTDEG